MNCASARANLNEEAASLRGQNERLVPEVEPFKARIALLESSTEPLCPTCGQPLTPEHRQQVVAELNAEVETRRHLFRDNKARLEAIKPEVTICRKPTHCGGIRTAHAADAASASGRTTGRHRGRAGGRQIDRGVGEAPDRNGRARWLTDRQKQAEIAAQIGVGARRAGRFRRDSS